MSTSEHRKQLQIGIEQFNARLFFEAHETWEEIWLASAEPEKSFLQGIIQIAAAFHHYSRGNTKGTCSLLDAGLRRLESFPDQHNAVALGALRDAARAWATGLARGEDPGAARLPKIEWVRMD